MIASVHAVTGAALGAVTGNPAAAFVTGLVSHGVLDAVPHTDYQTTGPGVVDGLAGLLFLTWLALAQPGGGLAWAAFWGGLGGMLPDVEVAVAHLFFQGRMRHLYPSHTGLTPHRQVAPPLGIWTQAITFAVALALLIIRLA